MSTESEHLTLGHYFDGTHVHRIFLDPTHGQYYIHPKSKAPIYRDRLPAEQVWGERGGWFCTFPHLNRIVAHEAGHAAICCLEQIKIEYVTLVAFEVDRQRFTGMCQWDYCIEEKRLADPCLWAEKEAKM